MPATITVNSSDCVRPGRNGRIVKGASVWPMKMLAATSVDSAPLAPMTRCITLAIASHDDLHHAEVVEDREEGGDENDDRKDLEGEHHAEGTALGAELSPKTNLLPASAYSSSALTATLATWNTLPTSVFRTRNAKANCSPRPHNSRLGRIASYARKTGRQRPRIAMSPSNPVKRPIIRMLADHFENQLALLGRVGGDAEGVFHI